MIVLADHEKESAKSIVSIIGEMGYAVTVVTTAADLIWNLKNTTIKLLLLNPELPDMGDKTFNLIRKMRTRYSKQEVPILVLTFPEWRGVRVTSLESGANDVIHLPVDEELTRLCIANHLELKKEYDDLRNQYARIQDLNRAEQAQDLNRTLRVKDMEDSDTLDLVNQTVDFSDKTEQTVHIGSTEKTVVFTPEQARPSHLFNEQSDPDKQVPCEIPVNLMLKERSAFCKTIWLARREILLCCFEELPETDQVKIQMYDTHGSRVVVEGRETNRKRVKDKSEGVLRLHIEVTDVSENYESLFFLLQETFHDQGLAGLKSAFPGEEGADSPSSHYARNLGATMTFSSSELSLNLMKGFRYKFEKRLGRGSFASVYLVRDMVLKRTVAMKVLNHDFCKENDTRLNFLSEAQIAAQFHHPNIVFVYEVGEILQEDFGRYLSFPSKILNEHPERLIYFTMQCVEGETLRSWISMNPETDVETMTDLWLQMGEALGLPTHWW